MFFFGGSTGFGYGVPDDETVPSHLQQLLPKASGRTPRVYNFARDQALVERVREVVHAVEEDGQVEGSEEETADNEESETTEEAAEVTAGA